MSAILPSNGVIRKLDGQAEPDEQITPEQVKDPSILARLLMRVLRDVARLKRKWQPRHIDHEDRVVDATGTTKYRFPHGFNGRVRWWIVDWSGSAAPALAKSTTSDTNTLVLVSYVAGTVTVRVQEAG